MKPIPLTVAIPTMRRWDRFLSQSLPEYLESINIEAVVISDETGEDVAAIRASPWANHPKLILHVNAKQLGIYYNKLNCIRLAPTDWIAILDSDNFFDKTFFANLQEIWYTEGATPKHFYACGNGKFINEMNGEVKNPIQPFADTLWSRDNWNTIFDVKGWNFMLNDGNWTVHKSVLDVFPTDIDDKDILATDAIYMVREMVAAGYTYDIRGELSYTHMIHKGSSWSANVDANMRIWRSTNWKIE
jgi:glycosyltransferase involved in cell wall biosynthesis